MGQTLVNYYQTVLLVAHFSDYFLFYYQKNRMETIWVGGSFFSLVNFGNRSTYKFF